MIEEILKTVKKNLFLIFLIVLISFLSFYLGWISKTAGQPIKIEKAGIQEVFTNDSQQNKGSALRSFSEGGVEKIDFRVVASKKSTSGKYHFLWCPGAKQIKEENKIFFNSEKEAVSAGYVLAANCLK